MRAFQSERFRKMPAEAKRAMVEAVLAARYPEDTKFNREFDLDGKRYEVVVNGQVTIVEKSASTATRPGEL